MNKWLEILLGLILILVPLILALGTWPSWWAVSLDFLLGTLFWGIVGLGLLFLMLGISHLKG